MFILKLVIVTNFDDDTTLNAFILDLKDLIDDLEYDSFSSIMWFDNNFMKLNEDKCHFLISSNTHEHLYARVGNFLIWESLDNCPE